MASPFKIDGVEVPPPHNKNDTYEWNRVSRSYNNSKGDFIDKTIAQKDKFFWEYEYLTAAELQLIEGLIKPKLNTGENSFMITSWTPDRGFITKRCYVGTPIQYKVIASVDGAPSILSVAYHWIQIEGHKSLELGGV